MIGKLIRKFTLPTTLCHPVAMNPLLKVAIVGGGPSAFYVASRLLSLVPPTSTQQLRIHIYDRLWSPYGLVRYGVAPDHPEVKVAYIRAVRTSQY